MPAMRSLMDGGLPASSSSSTPLGGASSSAAAVPPPPAAPPASERIDWPRFDARIVPAGRYKWVLDDEGNIAG
eukprot:2620663-Alexandrium_andersonii.AAC.1